ncbi:hypothetical protein STEG23_003058 [Scotinomys teguina]
MGSPLSSRHVGFYHRTTHTELQRRAQTSIVSDHPHSYRGFPSYLGTLLSSAFIADLPHFRVIYFIINSFSDPFPNSPSFPDRVKATRPQPPRPSAFIYKRSFLLCAGPTIVPVRLIWLAPLLTTVLDSYHSRRRSPYGPPAVPRQDTTPEFFCGN